VLAFIFRRLFQAVIVLIGVTLLAFILQHLIPGNLARAILGPRATPAAIAHFDHEYGLNRSLPVQYLAFVNQLIHGNLGYSYKLNQSVDSLVGSEVPKDLVLVGSALVLAPATTIPLGVIQAAKRNSILDYSGTGLAFIVYSMPSYWLGLLLVAGLAIGVHLFPADVPQASNIGGILADPRALVLPVATLTLVYVAMFSRYMRGSVIETLAEDYIRTAKAKGTPRLRVLVRHALRNSLIPVATLVGLSVPALLTDGIIVEYVFNFPGIGLTYFTAAVTSDYPVELGITVLVGVATVLGNLLADLAYAALDPRVRYR
jgi:peptide/nickel transport system permease protein